MSVIPANSKARVSKGRSCSWLTAAAVARLAIAVALSALMTTVFFASPREARGAVPDCASAANARTWDGGAGTQNWGDQNNWAGNVLPGANEIACIGDATVNFNVSAEVDAVVSGPDGTLSMTSGQVLTLSPQSGEDSQIANVTGGRPALAGAGDLIVTKSFSSTIGIDTLAGPAGSKLTLASSVGANALISSTRLDGRTLVVANGVTVTNPAASSSPATAPRSRTAGSGTRPPTESSCTPRPYPRGASSATPPPAS